MFSGCTVLPDSKETKLKSNDQVASPSAGKNTGVLLVPCLCMEVHPYSCFRWCRYFWGPWVSFLTTDEFSVRVTKIQGLLCHKLTAYLSIINQFKLNELWPYYQTHVNQMILNHATLQSLAWWIFEAFVQILLMANLFLNQTLLKFLLCVRQTWMTQLILSISPWEVIFLLSERILSSQNYRQQKAIAAEIASK